VTIFRFTIRELVLVTLVVAMGVGWWIDRRQLQRESQQRINALGSVLDYLNRDRRANLEPSVQPSP
jgi:hypothetical protein